MEHTSLTERGRSAFQQAEVDKFRNPTAAAAHYITASKCFIAAAEMVDLLEVMPSKVLRQNRHYRLNT